MGKTGTQVFDQEAKERFDFGLVMQVESSAGAVLSADTHSHRDPV
jgi:hypothetical protein